MPGPGLPRGVQDEVQDRRTGQRGHAAEAVVGQPRLFPHRQQAGQDETAGVGERDGRADQRMAANRQARRRDRTGRSTPARQPVPTMLKRIGRQRHAPDPATGEHARPVRIDAVGVQRGQRLDRAGRLRPTGPQHRLKQACAVRGAVVQRSTGKRGQHSIRSDLNEPGRPEFGEREQPPMETNRLPHLPHPVIGVGRLGRRKQLTGHRGHQPDRRLAEHARLGVRAEGGEDRVHPGAVEGVRDPHLTHPPALARDLSGHLAHRVLVAGDDHGPRTVDGGEPDLPGEQARDLLLGHFERGHRPTRRERTDQPPPLADQPAGLGKGQQSGRVCGGELADRMTEDEVGAQTPGFEQPRQGDFEGEQGGLSVGGIVQARVVVGEDDLAQRHVQMKPGAGLVEGRGIGREGAIQAPTHPAALSALAGEQKCRAAFTRRAADEGWIRPIVGERG